MEVKAHLQKIDVKLFGSRKTWVFKNAGFCMFLQRQTNTSLAAEIGAAALDLLLNLEVKFPRNAVQAGLFSPWIEVLFWRKLEY